MTETTVKLPTEEYEIVLAYHGNPSTFKIEPLPRRAIDLIEEAVELGAKVWTFSKDKPTAVYLKFERDTEPIEQYGANVVGITMRAVIHLLGNDHDRNLRQIENFVADLRVSMEEGLPERHDSYSNQCLVVRREYQY